LTGTLSFTGKKKKKKGGGGNSNQKNPVPRGREGKCVTVPRGGERGKCNQKKKGTSWCRHHGGKGKKEIPSGKREEEVKGRGHHDVLGGEERGMKRTNQKLTKKQKRMRKPTSVYGKKKHPKQKGEGGGEGGGGEGLTPLTKTQ